MRKGCLEPRLSGRSLEMIRIKVCGVRRIEDLDALAAAGVDAVGFNFVPQSKRFLPPGESSVLTARAAELGLTRVAVVMNPTAEHLSELLAKVDVDWVQLHGRESPSLVGACRGLPIIKATSWSGRVEEEALVAAWQPLAVDGGLAAWLVDAYAPIEGGGTGQTAPWKVLVPRPAVFANLPLILAGGLNAENVAAAIETSGADGVDTASGVELAPGVKSSEMIRSFAKRAREAEGWN